MLQKSIHEYKEKYSYVHEGTLETMRIKDTLTKTDLLCRTAAL